jgi:hypothetical protein
MKVQQRPGPQFDGLRGIVHAGLHSLTALAASAGSRCRPHVGAAIVSKT